MTISRRAFSAGFALGGVCAPLWPADLFAETYVYDALGRVTRVTYPNGAVVEYAYDAAGNRIQVSAPQPAGGFTAAMPIAGAAPINLRTIASNAGYNGAQNATITFVVPPGLAIIGSAGTASSTNGNPGGVAIDTGTWPGGYTLALTLRVLGGGKVYGGGGGGGSTPPGGAPAFPGGAGGDALYCRAPFTVLVDNGGEIRGGGGGGGSGGTGITSTGGPGGGGPLFANGGGAGGGFPNGAGGTGHNNGAGGATSNGGAGGNGGSASGTGGNATGGKGGNGGGATGGGATGANGSGPVASMPGATGGVPGYAIRKNGHTVSVTNNGTITGTVG